MTKSPSLKVRFIFYPIVGLLFVVFSYLIMLNATGYIVRFQDGKIVKEKTGTIILASRPGEARVIIDGVERKEKTPSFSFLNIQIKRLKPGEHEVLVLKDGYQEWRGIVNVEAGLVTWGNLILLTPQKADPEPFQLVGNAVAVTRAADNSHFLVKTKDDATSALVFWDIENKSKIKKKVLEKIPQEGENLAALGYSYGQDRILFQRAIGTKKELFVYENKESPRNWNITSLFQLSFDSLAFNPKKISELYAVRGHNLYKVDYESKTVSAVLHDNVVSQFVEDGIFYFVQQSADGKAHLFKMNGASSKNLVINSLPTAKKYRFAYLNQRSGMAVLGVDTKKLYLYGSTTEPYQKPKLVATEVAWMLPSPGGQYLGYSHGTDYLVYEPEKDNTFTTYNNEKSAEVYWLPDQFNLLVRAKGKLTQLTYNGNGKAALPSTVSSLPVISGYNSDRFYYFAENKDKKTIDLFVFDYDS